MGKLTHTVVVETTHPDKTVECRIQRFRCLPISDMDEALLTVHSWEDGVQGMLLRGEDELFGTKVG